MSAELAIQSDDQTSTSEVIARMDAWVQGATTLPELEAALQHIREVKTLLRMRRAASAVRIAAARLEFSTMRRIAQLGATARLHGSLARIARDLAALSERDFDDFLSSVSNESASVNATWVAWCRERGRDTGFRDGREIAHGRAVGNVAGFGDEEASSVREAANALIAGLVVQGQPFTVAETADLLEKRLALPPSPWQEGIRDALRGVVRDALIEGNRGSDESITDLAGRTLRHPETVTYAISDERSGARSYVRIPWATASIGQLAAMATLRREQAQQVSAAADELEEIVQRLRAYGADDNPCDGAWRVACAYAEKFEKLLDEVREGQNDGERESV